MTIIIIVFYLTLIFAGYVIGRIGHVLGGQIKSPHHWIYGVALMLVGMTDFLIFFEDRWSLALIAFGVGLAVSDLDDMIDFKIYGVDPPGKKKFWNID